MKSTKEQIEEMKLSIEINQWLAIIAIAFCIVLLIVK